MGRPHNLLSVGRVARLFFQERADTFRSQLAAAGLGTRPIVFICHSMGGLLIKRLLLDCQKFADKTVRLIIRIRFILYFLESES